MSECSDTDGAEDVGAVVAEPRSAGGDVNYGLVGAGRSIQLNMLTFEAPVKPE